MQEWRSSNQSVCRKPCGHCYIVHTHPQTTHLNLSNQALGIASVHTMIASICISCPWSVKCGGISMYTSSCKSPCKKAFLTSNSWNFHQNFAAQKPVSLLCSSLEQEQMFHHSPSHKFDYIHWRPIWPYTITPSPQDFASWYRSTYKLTTFFSAGNVVCFVFLQCFQLLYHRFMPLSILLSSHPILWDCHCL